MRIWDALTPSYRLSYSYVARVVLRIATGETGWHSPHALAERLRRAGPGPKQEGQ